MTVNDLTTVTRRTTLAALVGFAGTSLLGTLPVRAQAQANVENSVFKHGVASGDPTHDSVVLWTRLTTTGEQQVQWQLARDLAFATVIKQGSFTTDAQRDHTVKLLADALEPGAVYYYRFLLGTAVSPVGRTRTLPRGKLDRLGIALASCSNYAFGFFNAYDAIASDANVDFVLHTGDYIYEYGQDGWGDEVAQTLGRRHAPAHEIVSLADYRTRHAQYKTDAGAQAMHSAHPLLACWDDHESANNPWTGGAQNHQQEKEGSWQARRAASIQAYFEWMPVREPEWLGQPGRSRLQFWRSYSFGDLATLCTLETRHTARAEQIDYLAYADKITNAEEARHLVEQVIGAPNRPMLAPALEADLAAALKRSVESKQPWRLIGNPMPIARTQVPDVVKLGLLPDPTTTPNASDDAKALAWKGKWNLPFYPDTWDGYEWARERLYQLSRQAGAADLVFLTGDSHSFWANQLSDAKGQPAGIELGTAGISSPGDFMASGFGAELSPKLDQAFIDHNPEIVWTDNMHQGYVRLELTHTGAQANFIAVDTVLQPAYRTLMLARFALVKRAEGIFLEG
jgi:alkaline phosphatase D